MNQCEISSYKGSSLSVVLVLFILLVIVTSVFCFPSSSVLMNNSDDPSSSILGQTEGFDIVNNSSFVLNFVSVSGDSSPPSPLYLSPGGGQNHFELSITYLSTTSANVIYQGLNNISLSFTLRNVSLWTKHRNPRIVSITTTGPISAIAPSSSRLVITNA
ncbi:hypothetical protein SAMN05444162_1290 [Paenibacillaceae bacterium GAS479]|nr:hypothetical protein SAMN05444162_1290 [Paenibacillaceae bacterium GAS479]